jgi:hypothetical protein
MMIFRFLVALAFAFLVLSPAHAEDDYRKTIDLFKRSPVVQPFFKNAYGYAVFPTIGKGGIGVGAAHGQGRVYQGGKVTVKPR